MWRQHRMPLSLTLQLNYLMGGPLEKHPIKTFEQFFMPLARFVLNKMNEGANPALFTPEQLI
jgi:hypothetical protein